MSRKGQTPMSVFGPAGRLKGRMRYAPTLPAGEAAIPNDDRLAINITLLFPLNPSFEKMRRRFGIASFHPKRPKRSLQLFRVARNDQKEVCSHFGSPETTKKKFAAISGHPKRLKRSLQPFRAKRCGVERPAIHTFPTVRPLRNRFTQ